MGKREVESFALWKPFSLLLRFSHENIIGRGEAPFCWNLPDTPRPPSAKTGIWRSSGAQAVRAKGWLWFMLP
jgi:hypothetical protein